MESETIQHIEIPTPRKPDPVRIARRLLRDDYDDDDDYDNYNDHTGSFITSGHTHDRLKHQQSDTSSVTLNPCSSASQLGSLSDPDTTPWTIHAENIFKGWWLEMFCCWLSIASLGVMVIFLHRYNNEPLPNWPSGITVNTVVASLATVARTAFTIPVAEGLSQSKWNWFKKKPRPLRDFDLFDSASRGPLGSLSLLARTKGWLVGILSALLLVSAIGTSTLTQSAVMYPERNVEGSGHAPAWRLESFVERLHVDGDFELNEFIPRLTRAVAQAIFSPVTTTLTFKEPFCPQSDCTWPRYSTMAVCHNMSNVTSLLQIQADEDGAETFMALPNGVNMTVKDHENVVIGAGDALSDFGPDALLSSILNYSVIYWDGCNQPRAADIVLHWCINTYDSKMEDNVLMVQRVLSHTECRPPKNPELVDAIELVSPAEMNNTYVVGGVTRTQISDVLVEALTGYSSASRRIKTGSDRLLHAIAEIRFQYEAEEEHRSDGQRQDIWWAATDKMAQNIETGLVNFLLLDAPTNIEGTPWKKEVHIQVRWEWLTFLATQVVLSVVILVMIIWETAKADIDIIKSSTLPSLFAIDSKELAELESRFEEGEPLVEKDHRQVVPWGIGGRLHKTDGKWLLRST